MAMMGAGMGSGADDGVMLWSAWSDANAGVPECQRRGKIEYNIEYRIDIDQTWIRWETIVYIQYIQYIQYSIIFKYNHE